MADLIRLVYEKCYLLLCVLKLIIAYLDKNVHLILNPLQFLWICFAKQINKKKLILQIFETPFYVVLDRRRETVIVSIRGTLSLKVSGIANAIRL